MGRTSQSKVVVFDKANHSLKKGDYVQVTVNDFTKGTLLGAVKNN
jgi:hypothetical protein